MFQGNKCITCDNVWFTIATRFFYFVFPTKGCFIIKGEPKGDQVTFIGYVLSGTELRNSISHCCQVTNTNRQYFSKYERPLGHDYENMWKNWIRMHLDCKPNEKPTSTLLQSHHRGSTNDSRKLRVEELWNNVVIGVWKIIKNPTILNTWKNSGKY